MKWPYAALALVWLAPGAAAPAEKDRKAVPVYTNEDLDRVSPRRAQTGVSSEVAPASPADAAAEGAGEPPEAGTRARSETYWRRQADAHRRLLERFQDRIRDLQARIASFEARPPRRRVGAAEPPVEDWRRQVSVLEEKVREADARFFDRARRAGALPGWLR